MQPQAYARRLIAWKTKTIAISTKEQRDEAAHQRSNTPACRGPWRPEEEGGEPKTNRDTKGPTSNFAAKRILPRQQSPEKQLRFADGSFACCSSSSFLEHRGRLTGSWQGSRKWQRKTEMKKLRGSTRIWDWLCLGGGPSFVVRL